MELQESVRIQTDIALFITNHLFSKQQEPHLFSIFPPRCTHHHRRRFTRLHSFLRSNSVDHLNSSTDHLIFAVLSNATAASPRLSFVNGVLADNSPSLTHSFKHLVSTHFKATLGSLDFQTKGGEVRDEVNSWVEKVTNGLVTELLPPQSVSSLTRLILANALYFMGEWKHKFDADITYNYNFHLLDGTKVKVPFMMRRKHHEKERFISVFDGFKVVRLSYKQGSRDK
ncbi:serpin-ZX-like [Lotus japonicus]|uniref:serpin-ZX-like n=1 Tax=Lotus japonicus TaxID=34305 RepID=UPI00258A9F24|nr:serpin-ZX-like [Lotus japonicus]